MFIGSEVSVKSFLKASKGEKIILMKRKVTKIKTQKTQRFQ
jgi:hypothetical protein